MCISFLRRSTMPFFPFNLHSQLGVALMLTLALLALPTPVGAQTAHFSYAQVTLGSGFSYPDGVAVDKSGNVFVADAQIE